jgi:hypothetical protein
MHTSSRSATRSRTLPTPTHSYQRYEAMRFHVTTLALSATLFACATANFDVYYMDDPVHRYSGYLLFADEPNCKAVLDGWKAPWYGRKDNVWGNLLQNRGVRCADSDGKACAAGVSHVFRSAGRVLYSRNVRMLLPISKKWRCTLRTSHCTTGVSHCPAFR